MGLNTVQKIQKIKQIKTEFEKNLLYLEELLDDKDGLSMDEKIEILEFMKTSFRAGEVVGELKDSHFSPIKKAA